MSFSVASFSEARKWKQQLEAPVFDELNTCLAPLALLVASIGPTEIIETRAAAPVLWYASTWVGPWGDCGASCGGGWQARPLLCAPAPGLLGEAWQCAGGGISRVPASQPCQAFDCSDVQWRLNPWQHCSAPCGGGTAVRTALCAATGSGVGLGLGSAQAAADAAAAAAASCAALPPPAAVEAACNTAACELHVWSVGAWGPCSGNCTGAGGTQNRTVACTEVSGGTTTPVTAAACSSSPPATTQHCGSEAGACAAEARCGAIGCSGHGICGGDGVCACAPGYAGAHCEVAPSCPNGMVDASGACCLSGLADAAGGCCAPGSALDGTGLCCSTGRVDACGVCGGTARAVDVEGACCASGVLDAQGLCCQAGDVDECGVCGGLSASCAIALSLTADAMAASDIAARDTGARALLREGLQTGLAAQLGVSPAAVSVALANSTMPPPVLYTPVAVVSGGPTAARFTAEVLVAPPTPAAMRSAPFSAASAQRAVAGAAGYCWTDSELLGTVSVAASYAGRTGVCGNGFCEVGERTWAGVRNGTCPADCPVPYAMCPSASGRPCGGAGRCFSSLGLCDCFAGYAGEACERCSPGYALAGTQRRHEQGRDGGGWGATLLPTPSPDPNPDPARGSPLHLREKFGSAPASPSLQDLMERLNAKEAMHSAAARSESGSPEPARMRAGALPGAAPRYRVVMFHQYPRELLRGWLRQHHIREEEVEFRVLPGAGGGQG
ncbi:hypothetical protein WJX81_005075 [Elliptochloris bilobata]|uniref:EGF-like domain-containing protein n=1 Tax=Elliptochloris bilobata TaxID=381761 RepID=A0AAW1SIJ1_9CHLO